MKIIGTVSLMISQKIMTYIRYCIVPSFGEGSLFSFHACFRPHKYSEKCKSHVPHETKIVRWQLLSLTCQMVRGNEIRPLLAFFYCP